MAAPLPVTQILAFRAPIVKGREVTVPVIVHGELHGLRADASVWRTLAHDLLGATILKPNVGRRKPEQQEQVEASAERSPFLKPRGKLL